MRNFRSLVLGLVLVILSRLGWGEDVYYCVEEHSVDLKPADSGDRYELKTYKPETFTFKYEADSQKLAIKGRNWGGDDLYYMDCVACLTQLSSFTAKTSTNMFRLREGRFNLAAAYSFKAEMRTGTCTKF
jgi:hypothetical protein